MKHFVQYDLETGTPLGYGSCSDEDFANQAREGVGVIETLRSAGSAVEVGGRTLFEVDLEAVREALQHNIDQTASAAWSKLSSPIAGQDGVYAAKAAEARAHKKGSKAADFPLLTAEAEARGISVAKAQAAILAKADTQSQSLANIEAARVSAKLALGRARTIPEMVDAASVGGTANG